MTLRPLPDGATQRQLPCPLCGRPAAWLLWSPWLVEPLLLCATHAQEAGSLDDAPAGEVRQCDDRQARDS